MWFTIAGEKDGALAEKIERRVAEKIAKGHFSPEFIRAVATMQPGMPHGGLAVSEEDLEGLRSLCSLYEVELRPTKITSHRRLVGPIIVGAKRLIYPILRAFLGDTLRQQRDFNAQVVTMLMDICRRAPVDSNATFTYREKKRPS